MNPFLALKSPVAHAKTHSAFSPEPALEILGFVDHARFISGRSTDDVYEGVQMSAYDEDVYAWAFEQARFLRERRFDLLDIEHLADEIEDVGKTELRELVKQISALLAYLLKWHYLPAERTGGWTAMIGTRRLAIAEILEESPSMRARIDEPRKLQLIWAKALAQVATETERDCFPTEYPWAMTDVLSEGWLPK